MSHRLKLSVASLIKNQRKRRNQTQEELAASSGLDRTYISGVERGTRNITLDSLEQIVLALRIPLETFVAQWGGQLKVEKSERKDGAKNAS